MLDSSTCHLCLALVNSCDSAAANNVRFSLSLSLDLNGPPSPSVSRCFNSYVVLHPHTEDVARSSDRKTTRRRD